MFIQVKNYSRILFKEFKIWIDEKSKKVAFEIK